jgi:hypothetical protein
MKDLDTWVEACDNGAFDEYFDNPADFAVDELGHITEPTE